MFYFCISFHLQTGQFCRVSVLRIDRRVCPRARRANGASASLVSWLVFIYIFIYLFIYLFICLFACLCIYLSIYLIIFIYLFIYFSDTALKNKRQGSNNTQLCWALTSPSVVPPRCVFWKKQDNCWKQNEKMKKVAKKMAVSKRKILFDCSHSTYIVSYCTGSENPVCSGQRAARKDRGLSGADKDCLSSPHASGHQVWGEWKCFSF